MVDNMDVVEVKVPDIGDFKDVPVIELLVKVGDEVKVEDSLVTLESDKATLDVPSPVAGVITELKIKVGDKVSEGTLVALVKKAPAGEPAVAQSGQDADDGGAAAIPADAGNAAPVTASAPVLAAAEPAPVVPVVPVVPIVPAPASAPAAAGSPAPARATAYASPSVRAFARELGVDVNQVVGSGPKGRITQADVQAFVKRVLGGAGTVSPAPTFAGGGLNLLPWPQVDFAKFGPIETLPLSRIKKISGANLARNWAMIPHVTQFDEADITELEAFRVASNKELEKSGVKLTMLAFLIKAVVNALQKFPDFNASLDGQGDEQRLVRKQYFHIGFAADTPNGLVVPVLRDADKKGIADIAQEMAGLAKKARDGKLAPAEMQGGCFSISSLGGIGGTAFTPIINAPEVAILGASKTQTKPLWDGTAFQPRLILPLSLSFDHRVIDGASAARFTHYLSALLADMRKTLL